MTPPPLLVSPTKKRPPPQAVSLTVFSQWDDKQILRRMRLCFLPDKKVSKSTQVEDADFPEEEDMDGDISDDSQESVSLLAEAKKHRYM